MIKILQIGLGPLGQKIAHYIYERKGIKTIAVVDKDPNLVGQDLGDLLGYTSSEVIIQDNIESAILSHKPDVAIIATVSDLKRILPQIEAVAKHGVSIVSTCEELSYPWDADPVLAKKINEIAIKHKIGIVSTGVNPGFLMDALPTFLTSVCKDVQSIEVNRFQDAQQRRLPFQKKVGAGLSLDNFEAKKQAGTLRHVGLTESMQLIANRMGWNLDRTEDIIEPVIAEEQIITKDMKISPGEALGVMQTGRAYVGEELKILLKFKASVGLESSFDEVIIKGTPDINSKIEGGVNGDIATSAIIINAIPQILRSQPGLKTMADLPLVSYFS